MASTLSYLLVTVLPCFIAPIYAYNVLLLGGDGSGSHYYAASSIGRELATRNHNITALVSDMYADSAAKRDGRLFNYRVYKSLVTEERFQTLLADLVEASLKNDLMSILKVNALAEAMMRDQCESILIDSKVLEQLKNDKFDLIIGDLWYICVGLVAQYLDVPFVTLTPHNIMSTQAQINMSPTNPSYIPEWITGLDTSMNFKERVINTLLLTITSTMNRRMLSHYDTFKVKYNIKPDISMFKTLGEAELWFINTDFVFDFPRPLMPNAIPVGGLTTKPAKPLTEDLEEFMQSSEEGVIIFSLGSYISITDQSCADLIGDTFAQLPQKVIWKHKGKVPKNEPENVKFMDVIPQNDLLGHPKTKLLIYQCGLNGVYEALYHGVPIICLPVFFDQVDNAQRVASNGMGLRLDLPTLTSAQLLNAIRTVLENDSFQSNVTRLSRIFRDNPKTPPQRAADWAEFVAKHGASHLRSAAHDLSFWQYHLVDVWAFLIGCIVTVVVVLFSLCRCVFKMLCSRKLKTE